MRCQDGWIFKVLKDSPNDHSKALHVIGFDTVILLKQLPVIYTAKMNYFSWDQVFV